LLKQGCRRVTRVVPSALGKEFVFFDHRGDGDLLGIAGILNSDDTAFALDADVLCERDFGRKRESEADRRSLLDRRIEIKADSASTNVANLGGFTMV
jgi:hypothetical protein